MHNSDTKFQGHLFAFHAGCLVSCPSFSGHSYKPHYSFLAIKAASKPDFCRLLFLCLPVICRKKKNLFALLQCELLSMHISFSAIFSLIIYKVFPLSKQLKVSSFISHKQQETILPVIISGLLGIFLQQVRNMASMIQLQE